MPRITAAERKRQEAEVHDRAVFTALAWPSDLCPQPFTGDDMDRLCVEKGRSPVQAWTYNARSKSVSFGCFDAVHHSFSNATKTTTQTRGGPWFATEVEALLALRWAVCRAFAEDLLRLDATRRERQQPKEPR